jgi:hypothetical protein
MCGSDKYPSLPPLPVCHPPPPLFFPSPTFSASISIILALYFPPPPFPPRPFLPPRPPCLSSLLFIFPRPLFQLTLFFPPSPSLSLFVSPHCPYFSYSIPNLPIVSLPYNIFCACLVGSRIFLYTSFSDTIYIM